MGDVTDLAAFAYRRKLAIMLEGISYASTSDLKELPMVIGESLTRSAKAPTELLRVYNNTQMFIKVGEPGVGYDSGYLTLIFLPELSAGEEAIDYASMDEVEVDPDMVIHAYIQHGMDMSDYDTDSYDEACKEIDLLTDCKPSIKCMAKDIIQVAGEYGFNLTDLGFDPEDDNAYTFELNRGNSMIEIYMY